MSPVLFPPNVVLPIWPRSSSLFLKRTQPSVTHLCYPPVYIFYLAVKLTTTLACLFGLRTELITCFPVHKNAGFIIVGGGRLISSFASVNHERINVNSCLVKKVSLEVSKKLVVKKS